MIPLVVQLLQTLGPQFLEMFTKHLEQTGRVMTPEELQAKIDAEADKIIAKGEDWLKNHPK